MHGRLKKLLRDEKIKWKQSAKEKDPKEGDGITKYFHLKATERTTKKGRIRFQFSEQSRGYLRRIRTHCTCG
jgi:hypothetical protein